MGKFWGKKENGELLGSPQETMGFSKEYSSLLQNFIIRKYDFTNLNQVEDIKKQLLKEYSVVNVLVRQIKDKRRGIVKNK